jgi:hypothetical protein
MDSPKWTPSEAQERKNANSGEHMRRTAQAVFISEMRKSEEIRKTKGLAEAKPLN